ncbi:MAG: transposase [Clostridia bacterium]|nr:transposase [Clostridia bacterium]
MIKVCKQNQQSIINKLYNGTFDNVAVSMSNLADDILLSMHENGVLKCLSESIIDKRADNITIPFDLILALSIAAKLKNKTSLTDIPFAITDHRVLAKLGYNIIDTDGNLKSSFMNEGSIRFLINKYTDNELFSSYNKTVQDSIMPHLDISPSIHMLDCTEISVNLKNENYEKSAVCVNKAGDVARGYKLATLRGIHEDSGVIEEICFGAINTHDFKLCKNMLYSTTVLKPNDILVYDRGFIDRDITNFLKTERQVDTYIPLSRKMYAYEMAVSTAKIQNNWEQHPTRTKQKIALVTDLKRFWESDNPENDVPINAAVSWEPESDNYFVFITTDTTVSAKQIIKTYELRPEIEEDYRQLKDFWNLEDFKSTKLNMIAFHILSTLFGYLFFQLYTMTPNGEQYAHKSLPIILKNYNTNTMPYLIFYTGNEFAILSIVEFAEIYSLCSNSVQKKLNHVFNS